MTEKKIDLTVDSGSWETREVVAGLLGWKKEELQMDGSFDAVLVWRMGNSIIWDSVPLPDFLHSAKWTGPLLERLRELCRQYEYRWRIDEGVVVLFKKKEDKKILTSFENYRFKQDQLPNIAIAQAIQAVQEEGE